NNARVIFGTSVAGGEDNFKTIINNCLTFVDKSMLIKEFIVSSDSVSLILRPRRFGKSTNLYMLNSFFKIPYSHEDVIHKKLFEKLKISAEKEIMLKHFAKYPVIHFSLKVCEHRYLIKDLYQRILEGDLTYSESVLVFALKELSIYLRNYYKERCIVLIDEYDSPMECAYNNGYYKNANEFFKKHSNDENVAKAMLVGVLRIAMSGLSSELENITIYPLHQEIQEDSSPLYIDKFGFTENPENVYAFCLGMLVYACERGYIVRSNWEAGMERYNIKIEPKPGVNEIAIIIEFKFVHGNKSLYDMAREGLDQIEKKQYRVDLREDIKNLLEKGIAFEGKSNCMLGHLLHRTNEGTWNKVQSD
ncbi:8248_t:CDS:2, partial [Diversispora eburnea]